MLTWVLKRRDLVDREERNSWEYREVIVIDYWVWNTLLHKYSYFILPFFYIYVCNFSSFIFFSLYALSALDSWPVQDYVFSYPKVMVFTTKKSRWLFLVSSSSKNYAQLGGDTSSYGLLYKIMEVTKYFKMLKAKVGDLKISSLTILCRMILMITSWSS